MLFKIGDKIFNPNEQPCAVVFANDEERKRMIEILVNMKDKPGEIRWFCQHPSNFFTMEEVDAWMNLTDNEKALMTEGSKPPKYEL